MKHLFSKGRSRWAQTDEGDVDSQTKTLVDILEATKEHKANKDKAQYKKWDCVALESSTTNSWNRMINNWADFAHQGNWEELLRMGIETPDLINSRRLQKRIGPGGEQGRPPAGYTALHQAAWYGADVEIVLALINLGANRAYPISSTHLTTNHNQVGSGPPTAKMIGLSTSRVQEDIQTRRFWSSLSRLIYFHNSHKKIFKLSRSISTMSSGRA